MECKECVNLLYQYRDNELDSEKRFTVKAHLAVCHQCQTVWQDIEDSVAIYRTHITSAKVSDGFSKRVMAKLSDDNNRSAFTIPIATFGLSLTVFILVYVLFAPLIYPMLRMAFRLAMHLISLPGLMLSAFPLLLFAGLAVLLVALMTITWATRRVIIS